MQPFLTAYPKTVETVDKIAKLANHLAEAKCE
jgi:hypothetical protein